MGGAGCHRERTSQREARAGSFRAVTSASGERRGERLERQPDAPMSALHTANRREHLQIRPRKGSSVPQRRIHACPGPQQILDPPVRHPLGNEDRSGFA